ncbi:uroporphyrinogen-III synthase [Novosphingobium huizhouense]|uniref:uroporphyrinogen-III synthase n=1 Tax=Novosphingobium huizhouense TaxID=2866625 RepID=UPI001CD883F4|nr:uroporphyrinogen-III synthase [Novosphingobium huizhouense]
MRPLVVLRPEPGNTATAHAARALGLIVHAHPLFAMAPVPWELAAAADFDALLAGSAALFRLGGAGLAGLRALPVHAVGEATAAAARGASFTVAGIGEGGMEPLVAALPPGRYLRLAGERNVPLMPPPGVEVDTRVVYAARALPLPPDLAASLAAGAVVALHSGEAAAHFAAECSRLKLSSDRVSLACLAPRIATKAGKGWQSIEIAPSRTDDALLALAAQMCQTV